MLEFHKKIREVGGDGEVVDEGVYSVAREVVVLEDRTDVGADGDRVILDLGFRV